MMSLKASFVLFSFTVMLVQSKVTDSSDELYWKLKLGNITMPKILKASLQLGPNKEVLKLNSAYQMLQDPEKVYYYHINYVNENPVPQDGRVEFFTIEKLLISGTKMKLHFNQIDDVFKFLPLKIAKSMTLASNKIQEILNILSLNSKSIEAKYIENMIQECELKGIEYESRYCAASLHAIVDLVTSKLSSKNAKLMVVSTEDEMDNLMEYKIQDAQKVGNDDKHNLVCHKLNNPFVVFLCHNIRNTNIYGVSLVGTNGKKKKVIAVCHMDTSKWFPGHASFKLLNLKPGSGPICHFLSGDAMVWLQN